MIKADLVNISICLTDLDKSKFKKADNGKLYLNATIGQRKETDKFGNDLTVFYSKSKEEREAKTETVYIPGNAKSVIFEAGSPPTFTEEIPTKQEFDDLPF